MAAMFRRLENGRYALTGRSGDSWDVTQAPEWRSQSKFADPFVVQASNVAGSIAFAVNVVHNAAGRVLCDIPALVDGQLKNSIGVDFDELSNIARSVTPGNPLDDLPLYLLARVSEISRFGKSPRFAQKLVLAAERMQHIEKGHGWKNLRLPKSLFFPEVDIQKLIRQVEGLPKIPQQGQRFAQIGIDQEWIGLDCVSGKPTKIYTVISDEAGNVITSHPGLPDPKFASP